MSRTVIEEIRLLFARCASDFHGPEWLEELSEKLPQELRMGRFETGVFRMDLMAALWTLEQHCLERRNVWTAAVFADLRDQVEAIQTRPESVPASAVQMRALLARKKSARSWVCSTDETVGY